MLLIKSLMKTVEALDLGWKIVRYVRKSNAIVIANSEQVLGIGAGQMSRIDSLKIAIEKLKDLTEFDEAIIASDAFFPFADSLEVAAENKIFSIIQPGGSIKDKEIIEKANQLGISMVFTSERHFYH